MKDEDLPKLLEHLNVKSMKNNPAVNGEAEKETGLFVATEEGFIRKGMLLVKLSYFFPFRGTLFIDQTPFLKLLIIL